MAAIYHDTFYCTQDIWLHSTLQVIAFPQKRSVEVGKKSFEASPYFNSILTLDVFSTIYYRVICQSPSIHNHLIP